MRFHDHVRYFEDEPALVGKAKQKGLLTSYTFAASATGEVE
jgi:hypothetical protein